MSHTALIKFAPVASKDVLLNPEKVKPGRSMYGRAALKFKPGEIPLVVDHDKAKQIGVVREFSVIDDLDGQWHAALCRVDRRPTWLKRGTGASFKRIDFQPQQKIGAWTRINSCMVLEVTVTSPAHEPVDEAARVMIVSEDKPRPAELRRRIADAAKSEARLSALGLDVRPGSLAPLREPDPRPASQRTSRPPRAVPLAMMRSLVDSATIAHLTLSDRNKVALLLKEGIDPAEVARLIENTVRVRQRSGFLVRHYATRVTVG